MREVRVIIFPHDNYELASSWNRQRGSRRLGQNWIKHIVLSLPELNVVERSNTESSWLVFHHNHRYVADDSIADLPAPDIWSTVSWETCLAKYKSVR